MHIGAAVMGAAGAGLALWELATRRWEGQQLATGHDYWRNYADAALRQRADRLRQTASIVSTGVPLHIDVYPQPDRAAPVIVLNHGGGSYGRMALKLTFALYDRGYTLVVGDRRGQGRSGGVRGDTTWTQEVQNVVDLAGWASGQFGGLPFLVGGSLGGPLCYYAAAAGAPVQAIACLNLYDWSPDSPDATDIFGAAARAVATRLAPLIGPLGWLRVPWRRLNPTAWRQILDPREPEMKAIWDRDPLPLRFVTLALLQSLTATAPAVPLAANTIPTLVINQRQDRMTDPAITKRNFERLGGPKAYTEVAYGHYSFSDHFNQEVAAACDDWFRARRDGETRGAGPTEPVSQ